jgi:3-phosphoglycerate kinase
MGLDIGEQSIARFSEVILNSKVILWNGPMGVFEMSNFSQGTVAIAQALVSATKNGAFTLVGGGDSGQASSYCKAALLPALQHHMLQERLSSHVNNRDAISTPCPSMP